MNTYLYKGYVDSIYDGDSCAIILDLGFGITKKVKIRLAHINTPELRGEERPEGIIARDYLRGLILHKDVIVETIKDRKGKYGRWLGEIFIDDGKTNVNELLVTEGLAEKRVY